MLLCAGINISSSLGSGCGSVGRAVPPYSRDPRFKPRRRQNLATNLSTNCIIEKTKIKKKRLVMAHLLKNPFLPASLSCLILIQSILTTKLTMNRFSSYRVNNLCVKFLLGSNGLESLTFNKKLLLIKFTLRHNC